MQKIAFDRKTAFTLVEMLVAIGILVSFLAASLVAFTSSQNLSESSQQRALAVQGAKAKLEEMRAMDFRGLLDWYNTDEGSDGIFENRAFDIPDLDGKGSIVLTDVYDNWAEATPSAAWSGRSGHAAVVFDDEMWVLGGYRVGDLNDVWYSENGAVWTEATTLDPKWIGRDDHAAVVFDNKIWVLGGMSNDSGSYLNDVWYSSDGANWTEATTAAAKWSVRNRFPSVIFDNKIWVLGGKLTSGTQANDVWYSENGADWTEVLANNPSPGSNQWSQRFGHTAVVFDNKIWVLGGYAIGDGFLNDVWYSSDGADWTQAATIGSGRWYHTAVVFDNKIWVLGGSDSSGDLNDVWYSSDGANWTEASSAGWPVRSAHSSVVYGGKIWVLGGSIGNKFNDVWWSYGADRMYQVDITVSWRQRNGRIIGEDNGEGAGGIALNGIVDGDEDVDANGILDSPVHITGLVANRGYPAQIYMGRE